VIKAAGAIAVYLNGIVFSVAYSEYGNCGRACNGRATLVKHRVKPRDYATIRSLSLYRESRICICLGEYLDAVSTALRVN
jgi:hypothetical protein